MFTDVADRLSFTITLDAADRLLSTERSRLRICEGVGCGWCCFDRSKARIRDGGAAALAAIVANLATGQLLTVITAAQRRKSLDRLSRF